MRAALASEPDLEETRVEGDAETRELAQLTAKANVGSHPFERHIREAPDRSGAAAELQKHHSLGSASDSALEMLRIDRGVERTRSGDGPGERSATPAKPRSLRLFSLPAMVRFWASSARPCQSVTRPIRSCPPFRSVKGPFSGSDNAAQTDADVCRNQPVTRKAPSEFQLQANRRGTVRGP